MNSSINKKEIWKQLMLVLHVCIYMEMTQWEDMAFESFANKFIRSRIYSFSNRVNVAMVACTGLSIKYYEWQLNAILGNFQFWLIGAWLDLCDTLTFQFQSTWLECIAHMAPSQHGWRGTGFGHCVYRFLANDVHGYGMLWHSWHETEDEQCILWRASSKM